MFAPIVGKLKIYLWITVGNCTTKRTTIRNNKNTYKEKGITEEDFLSEKKRGTHDEKANVSTKDRQTAQQRTNKYKIMKQAIATAQAPAAIGPYSQAIEAAGTVYVSGQLPINPATGEFAEGGIKELTTQSLTNMRHILEEAGLTLANVVKTTVFLADMADFAEMNEVYAQFFEAPFPARSAVAVKTLPKGARVEIECIAVR